MREATSGEKEAGGGFATYSSDHPAQPCAARAHSVLWTQGPTCSGAKALAQQACCESPGAVTPRRPDEAPFQIQF